MSTPPAFIPTDAQGATAAEYRAAFPEIFGNPKHPLHDKARGEWRALIDAELRAQGRDPDADVSFGSVENGIAGIVQLAGGKERL